MSDLHPNPAIAPTDCSTPSGDPADPISWSFDPELGTIQGPLDLEFFRHRRLQLDLQAHQIALLIREGQPVRSFGQGQHQLDVGHGHDAIPPTGSLVFLDLGRHFTFSWTRMNPVSWGPDRQQALIGNCSLGIGDPEIFFSTFLAGNGDWEPVFLQRLMEQTVRGTLEAVLASDDFEPDDTAFPELQARITRLNPEDLGDHLEACGLTCSSLAVYTAAPPVEHQIEPVPAGETAGQFPGVGHN